MSIEKPRVLHLVYDLIRGGSEGQCARVAMELARRGRCHRVATFHRRGFFLERVEAACGPVHVIGIRSFASWTTLREIRRLAAFIRTERFDVVHGWDTDACIFGPPAARQAGVPFITSRRNLAEALPPHKRWLLRRADRRAAAVVVNADAVREQVLGRAFPVSKTVKIPNAVDLEEWDGLRSAPSVDVRRLPQGPVVGIVCRLDPEKDVDTFLRAAAVVARARKDASFAIAGDGRERTRLQCLAAELGLAERAVFCGDVADTAPLIARFAMGVLTPSRNEGLSNSILEYMAAGIPVVATDCGGNRELVGGYEAGRVVPIGDATAAARAIESLLDDPAAAAKMGRNGRRGVEEHHGLRPVADRFEALYERVAVAATR